MVKKKTSLASSYLNKLKGIIDNKYATVASDGTSADTAGYCDTGSYTLNALFAGDIFKGIPSNKVIALAGEEATGKTFFALGVAKYFLDSNPDGIVVLFESEGSIDTETFVSRNIDTERVLVIPLETVQQFKNQAIKVVEDQLSLPEDERVPMLFILDSLGMLSTTKEMTDSASGKEVKDMTRTSEIRAVFRVLTLKLSKAKIPMIVTNHVYQSMGMFPTKEMSGGGGLKYAASTIIFLGKSKDKDAEGNITGAVIRCRATKSRKVREGSEIFTLLTHNKGLDRYYGLVDLAIEGNIWSKIGNKVKVDDQTAVFEKAITKNPEKYFTQEILEKINEYVKKTFNYGNVLTEEEVVEEILEKK